MKMKKASTTVKKSAAKGKKAPVAKKAVAKPAVKSAAKKAAPVSAPKKPVVSPEQRYRMIQDAAYFLAERHGFNGDSAYFWSLAEAEINSQLQ